MGTFIENVLKAVRHKAEWPEEGEKIKVSKPGRTAGAVYEKVRNAVEYEEEHLVRQSAIHRIASRLMFATDEKTASRGEAFLTEMIWAKYLPNDTVPVELVGTMNAIFEKYARLLQAIDTSGPHAKHHREWLFEVMSTEIEFTLERPRVNEALASFMFDRMKRELTWGVNTQALSDQQKEMLVYVAIYRALLKSNLAMLRYRVFTLYYPGWSKNDPALIEEVAGKIGAIIDAVEGQIHHPYADQLFRLMRRYAMVFWVIGDIAKKHPDDANQIFANPERLKTEIRSAAYERYSRFKKNRKRLIARSVLFLILTKMVLAIIIEVPYELFVLGAIHGSSLAINILFHPLFLMFIGMTSRIPAKRNTDKLTEYVQNVLDPANTDAMGAIFKIRRPWTEGVLGTFFTGTYALTYVFSFGVIAWFLATILHFNVVSIVLFLFFFSLVGFFGIKVRQTVRELLVVEKQGSVLGTVFDFFMLPIVKVGRELSLRAPKVNILVFFLDFVIEAPFKLAIEVVEAWIAFIRDQKEQID